MILKILFGITMFVLGMLYVYVLYWGLENKR